MIPTLAKGKTVVEEEGSSPSRTTATREIYAADGTLIRSETWTTSYEGENRVIRVGTKVVTKPRAPQGQEPVRGQDAGRDELYPDDASAVAIASASHAGTRVGRYVSRSTVACRV